MIIVAKSLGMALVGLVLTPVAVFLLVLALAHLFDPRCGTPGDSGGCEMGAFSLAVMAAPVGAIGAFVLSLVLGLRSRGRPPVPPAPPA